MNLKEAREKNKLSQFIREREKQPPATQIVNMKSKPTPTRSRSPRRLHGVVSRLPATMEGSQWQAMGMFAASDKPGTIASFAVKNGKMANFCLNKGKSANDLFGAGSFVFLDDRPWPFMVNKTTDGWWLYYWSEGQKNFVTMRSLTEQEVERFRAYALPPEQAKHYRTVAENNWPKFKAPNDKLSDGGK